MSAPVMEHDDLVERLREIAADAAEQGEKMPGRPTLIELTGASDWQVRKALEALKNAGDDAPPTPSSEATEDPGWPPEDSDSELPTVVIPIRTDAAGEPVEQPGEQVEPPGEADHQQVTSGRQPRPWPLLIIGMAAAVAVWSGWVGLGRLTGFGDIQPLPGLIDNFHLNTAIVLPISVEAYAAYALRCWLSAGQFSSRTIRFSRWSAISSLVIGALAQVAYHLMAAAGMARAPWPITMLVACVPVVVLGLASALAKLVSSDRQRAFSAGGEA